MSDRIAVLSRGDLEQFGTPADIDDRPASVFVIIVTILPMLILERAAGFPRFAK